MAFFKAVFTSRIISSKEEKQLTKKFQFAINPLKKNDHLPSFSIRTLDGMEFTYKMFEGKYVLLDFWVTWCPSCMAELPFLKDIRRTFSNEKLLVIGISADISMKSLKAAVIN